MSRRLTYDEVKRRIEENNCILISKEYKNINTPLELQCSCGNKFHKTLKIMSAKGFFMCNECNLKLQAENQKISYEEVKERIAKHNHTLLTKKQDYISTKHKLYIRCEHGHTYEKLLSDFNKGIRCNKCSGEAKSKKQRTPFQSIKTYFNSVGYTLISTDEDYINMETPLQVVCDKGHEFNVSYGNFKNKNSRCPHCYNLSRGRASIIPYSKRKAYIESFGYKLLTQEKDYKNGAQKCLIECNKGHKYSSSINDFKAGIRCSTCNESKGEAKIKKILKSNGIKYKEQYKFKDCKFKRHLPFDFYLPDYNTLVEYDGGQHFKIVERFGGFDGFVDTKIRDTIKNIYCKENNIKLIRIPYWEFDNIEEILKDELNL